MATMMATMMAAAAVGAPYGLGKLSSLVVGQKSRLGRRSSAVIVKGSSSQDSQSQSHHSTIATPPPLALHSLFQDASKRSLEGAERWTEKILDSEFGTVVAPVAASVGFYLQASIAWAEEVEVEDSVEEWTAVLVASGVYAVLYIFVIPLIVYNYLRLRWYKRSAAETFFQFMLVFIFFPGMLLLAPFINFRRLPKEGTEPP